MSSRRSGTSRAAGQGLGGGHPDPQSGEQPGADVDGDAADLLQCRCPAMPGRWSRWPAPAARRGGGPGRTCKDASGPSRPPRAHARPGRWPWRCRAECVIGHSVRPSAARGPPPASRDRAQRARHRTRRCRCDPTLAVASVSAKRTSRWSDRGAGAARPPHSIDRHGAVLEHLRQAEGRRSPPEVSRR